MTILHVLRHEYEGETGEEEEKFLGIYSSEQRAREAIARFRDKPGFRDYPDGFQIYEEELDRDFGWWSEGFDTALPGPPQTKEYKH